MSTETETAGRPMKAQITQRLRELAAAATTAAERLGPDVERAAVMMREVLRHGGTLFFCGNGGSAADAQHLATEFVVRYRKNRAALPAIALTTDTSALTAIGNDFGFEELFARQVEALCRAGDVAIGITTSGNSENVIRGLRAAKAAGAVTVAFTGEGGGRLAGQVDRSIFIPSKATARIQEMHLMLGHVLCALLEQEAE